MGIRTEFQDYTHGWENDGYEKLNERILGIKRWAQTASTPLSQEEQDFLEKMESKHFNNGIFTGQG